MPLLLAFGAVPGGGLGAISARPPSSLEPQSKTAIVRFAYAHRIVTECTPRRAGPDRFCAEKIEPAPAQTQVELLPLPDASLENRKDERTAIRAGVSSAELVAKGIELGPGLWELRWPGYEHNERFAVDGGDSVDVVLRSTAGRCEITADGSCNLVRSAVRRRVWISFQRRESRG